MPAGKDKNHVSFWWWFFALFITAIPCIGWIMIIVFAFVGENESRKNHYRALIAWFLIFATIWLVAMVCGFWPAIDKQIETWISHLPGTQK